VDWKCGFPYPAAPPHAINVTSYDLRGNPRGSSGARAAAVASAACSRGPGGEVRYHAGVSLRSASRALSTPDVSLCLLKCGTSGAVLLVSRIVYPTTFPPKFPAFFSVEMGVRFFLSFPLALARRGLSRGSSRTTVPNGTRMVVGAPARPCYLPRSHSLSPGVAPYSRWDG